MEGLHRSVSILNALSGEAYSLVPLDTFNRSPEVISNIVKICNEPLVYRWCFKELCDGEPYPDRLAFKWLDWASEGWSQASHFVYAVTDVGGSIVAACDIKSANRDGAEIGYWASSLHRGIMTNAVRAMIDLADQCGFQTLFADIHPENHRSLAVIRRCGLLEVDRSPTIKGHISHERHVDADQ